MCGPHGDMDFTGELYDRSGLKDIFKVCEGLVSVWHCASMMEYA